MKPAWQLTMKTLGYMKVILLTSDDIGDYYGFVYRITNTTNGKQYIGRKYFTQKENQKEENEKLHQSQTGNDTTEALKNLNEILEKLVELLSDEKSSPSTQTLGKVNYEETKQLFLYNVLTEALDDGTPKYYNSNILGRYMKKDYGNFRTNNEENI